MMKKAVANTFDSQGRRTEYKSVTNGAQNTWLRFLYDGYLCVQVLYSNEPYNVFEEFVWDPTEPVATRPLVFRYAPNSLNLFYAFDGNKNVSDVFYRMTSNGIGAHYDYAPFGTTTRTHRDSSAAFDIVALNPFRFSSEYYDSELDFVYYNYRHYSPLLGRFLSRDPIREKGGLNLYAFVGNNPYAHVDALGKMKVCCDNAQLSWPLSLLRHCELSENECPPGRNWRSYPVTIDTSPLRKMDNGQSCKCMSEADLAACLQRHPYSPGRGKYGENCQTSVIRSLANCCLKSTWRPNFYGGAPRGKCLEYTEVFIPPNFTDKVCTRWEYPEWRE